MSILKVGLLIDFGINEEELLEHGHKCEGDASLNRVINDTVILIEELLDVVSVSWFWGVVDSNWLVLDKSDRLLRGRKNELLNESGALRLGDQSVVVEIEFGVESVELRNSSFWKASLGEDLIEHLEALSLVEVSTSVEIIFGEDLVGKLSDFIRHRWSVNVSLNEVSHLRS